MGEQNDPGTGSPGSLGHQAMTGDASGGGQTGLGFRTGPVQTAPISPGINRGPFREGGPVGAGGVQPVVDGQGQQTAVVRPGPVGGEPEQGDGVPAPGQGQRDGMIDTRFQPCGQDSADRAGPVLGRWGQPALRVGGGAAGGVQPMRVRASDARVRTAGLAASA